MKASLVAAFFMHLRHDKLFNTLAFLAAFLFLGIFILLTYDDLGVRAQADHGYAQKMSPETGSAAPGGEPATTATADDVAAAPEGAPKGAGRRRKEGVSGRGAGLPTGRRRRAGACCASPVCKRKHVPVDAEPELGFPTCATRGLPRWGRWSGKGHLRAGPFSAEKNVVERFELRRTSCGYAFHSRQEWPLAIADVEVRYDASLTPIWAWKRLTIAGSQRADGNADIRRYELRTGDVFIKRRDAEGQVTLEKLLPGGRMSVPAGATARSDGGSRARHHHGLAPAREAARGGKDAGAGARFPRHVRVTGGGNARAQSRIIYEPSLKRSVRAYTFFGQETVFADENDVVIGDLAGMRPDDSLTTPEPPPLPTFGGADPVHTP